MFKKLALAVAVCTLAVPASAQVHVNGYVNKNGTYVAPHYRSSPNGTTLDNYSTKGNVNPYTGQAGTKNPYSSYPSNSNSTYSKPRTSTTCTFLCTSSDSDDGN